MQSSQPILLCFLVRNAENNFRSQFDQFCKAFSGFERISFYFVESDSTDRTLEMLEALSREDNRVKYITLGRLEETIENRVERIRECRNAYVHYIRQNPREFEYVVVADFDGINSKLNLKSINSAVNSTVDWDMCSANQKHGYYDIYALRAQGWCESDYLQELNQFGSDKNGVELFNFRTKVIYDRMKVIPKNHEWIPVQSSFGGLAIYKAKLFQFADYSPKDDFGQIRCEHVDLNLKLSQAGFKLFINPSLINSSWNTYNVNRIKIVRRIRSALRYIKRAYQKKRLEILDLR